MPAYCHYPETLITNTVIEILIKTRAQEMQFTSIIPLWRVFYVILVVEGSVSHKREAMRGFILHQSNPPCRDVDTNKELKPCTLTNQNDYMRLMSVNSANPSPPGQLKISCKDGSNNMTCLPVSLEPMSYFCACDAEKGDLNTGIVWNDNWEEITESGLAIIKHSVCDAQAGWCLDGMFRMFKKSLVYLVKLYAPLDSQITVSSVYGSDIPKENIRLEYYGDFCAWIAAANDDSQWVKFDFLQSRVAVGVKIGKRCHLPQQYVTSFHVSTSDNDVAWSYIGTDVQAVYEGIIATWWFDRDVSARYWRIEPVTFIEHISMQADFIGFQ